MVIACEDVQVVVVVEGKPVLQQAASRFFWVIIIFFFSEGGLFSNRSLIPLMGYKICAEEAGNARKSLFDVFLASRVRLTAELAP